jgi:ankyrin repeat protein
MGEGEDLLQVLFRKIRHNKVGDVEPIVNAIGNVDERDEHGNSPLMVACQNGHKRISKLLLDLGAGINVQNVRILMVFICD